MARVGVLSMVVLGIIGTVGCQAEGPAMPRMGPTPPMGLTPPTETHDGVLEPHAVAQYNFATSSSGVADFRVAVQGVAVPPQLPQLFLTVRYGTCPQECGDIVADSGNGSLEVPLPAGSYSVAVGNPNDQRLQFYLVMNYAK
jgi:hypothetical protein